MESPVHAGYDYLKIHLIVFYGRRFNELYGDLCPDNMRTIWCGHLALGPYLDNKLAVEWVIKHLPPDFPPTVPKLRDLFIMCPMRKKEEPQYPRPPSKTEKEKTDQVAILALQQSYHILSNPDLF